MLNWPHVAVRIVHIRSNKNEAVELRKMKRTSAEKQNHETYLNICKFLFLFFSYLLNIKTFFWENKQKKSDSRFCVYFSAKNWKKAAAMLHAAM